VVEAVGGQQNDPGAHDELLGRQMATDQSFQGAPRVRRHVQRGQLGARHGVLPTYPVRARTARTPIIALPIYLSHAVLVGNPGILLEARYMELVVCAFSLTVVTVG